MSTLIQNAASVLPTARDDDDTTTPLPTDVVFMPIIGTAGDDVIDVQLDTTFVDGGAGDDVINYGVDLTNDNAPAIDRIIGGDGNDTVDFSNLVLSAAAQNTVLFSLGGLDFVFGTLYYGAVPVNSGFGFGFFEGDGATLETGSLEGIETIIGTQYNDILAADFQVDFQTLDGGLGRDYLFGNSLINVLIGGEGADIIDAGNAFIAIASYETATEGVRVSLARNELVGTGDAEGDQFIGILDLRGSDFNDYLEGDANANVLEGGLGNDRFVGGDGADALFGGDGTDLAIYSASSAGVTVNLARGTGTGGAAEGDTLDSIENVQGSQFGDVIIADGGNNLLSGLGGDDVLNGLGGNDNLIGGMGNDVLIGGDGIDALLGGMGNDVLRGGNGVDALYGGEGNDLLDGGAGRDTLDGGDGFDSADYRRADAGVTVNLGDSGPMGDIFVSIERVLGSSFDDMITGSDMTDVLVGGAGNDTIDGGAGDDSLFGGAGDDTILVGAGRDFHVGGDGADTFVATAEASGLNTILDFGFNDRIDVSALGADFDTFAEIQAAASNVGNSVVIDFGAARVQLIGVQLEQLTESLFIFDDGAMA